MKTGIQMKGGGLLKGGSHASGNDIPLVDDSTGKEIARVEGGEVVVNKKAVNKPGTKTLTGTNKEILHKINTETGGAPILKDGGAIPVTCGCGNSMEDGGTIPDIKSLYNKKTTKTTTAEVLQILAKVESEKTKLTETDKEKLHSYEGLGSVKGDTEKKTGILHEFFTPYWLTKELADIISTFDIKLDKVLDPATGTGRLLRYLDAKEITAFEVNETNARITEALYPNAKVYNQAFETAFLQPPRYTKMIIGKNWIGNDFDLVISNPPYGEYAGEYAGFMPKTFTRFETLFMAISMTVLKPGGYGVFVLPQSFMNNGNMYNAQKELIMKANEFVDAVRLPNKIFASTDIGVDILVLRKKSK